jgi:hypothetical protein
MQALLTGRPYCLPYFLVMILHPLPISGLRVRLKAILFLYSLQFFRVLPRLQFSGTWVDVFASFAGPG